MQSLNNLVVQGKVLYLGISDTPAWIVGKANEVGDIALIVHKLSTSYNRTLRMGEHALIAEYSMRERRVFANFLSIRDNGPPRSETSSGKSSPCVSIKGYV